MHLSEVFTTGNERLSAANADCSLELHVVYSTADTLQLHYQVRNTSRLPLYLCNQLYKSIRRDSSTSELVFAVQPNLINVQLDESRVTVGKAVVEVPEWIFVETLQIPCLSRVLPGEQFEEVLTLTLPLMPYTVYDYSPSNGPSVFRDLFFELGYFLASEYTQRYIEEVATAIGKAYYLDAIPVSSQAIIAAGPLSRSVQVIDHA